MAARGHAITERLPNGDRVISWIPEAEPEQEDRLRLARTQAKYALTRKDRALLDKHGVLHFFPSGHWQVRSGEKITLDFWMPRGSRATWRWSDEPTRKGTIRDFFADVKARSKANSETS